MSGQADTIEGWAILELMGHRRLAGRVSEVEFAGARFVRIDVPDDEGVVATQLYGAPAIYCLTPTTEHVARAVAKVSKPEPVARWELPRSTRTPDRIDVDDEIEEPY